MQTTYTVTITHDEDSQPEATEFLQKLLALADHTPFTAESKLGNRTTINEAVRAAMDEWLSGGTNNVDRMREYIDTLVHEATVEWHTDHVEATTDEEEEAKTE